MNEEDDIINKLLEEAESLEKKALRTEAMQVLRDASSIRKDPVVFTRVGALAADLGLWNEAETALQDAVALEPDFAPAHFYLGLLFQEEGRLAEALDSLKTALRYDPSPTNYTVTGVVQTKLDLVDEAQRSFRKAITLDPDYEEAYYNLATTLAQANKDEAVLLLQKAIEIDLNYASAHRELGRLILTEDLAEAEYHLRRAIELSPYDGWTHIYLGNLLWRSKSFAAAEAAFRRGIEVWPDRSVPYWCLAYFLERQGRPEEAQELYQHALEIDPADVEANRLFGIYLNDLGDFQEAKCYLLRALFLNPADKKALAMLSVLEKQLNSSSS